MADRLQGQASHRRSTTSSTGLSTESAGRGPTYERVQRLLEERRARAQAQASGRAQLEGHGGSAPGTRDRRARPFSSPESDESFAFDRPPYSSDGGVLVAAGSSPTQHHRHRSEVSSAYAQGSWQQDTRFDVPQGYLDELGVHDVYQVGLQDTTVMYTQDVQEPSPYEVEYQLVDEGIEDRQVEPRDQDTLAMHQDDANSEGGRTLSELEHMLNQTIQQFNIEEMRVPTSKDMALGMVQGDGPFDISDIWAVESQPSGSHQSGRLTSPSVGGISRDDGHEVNSYTGTHTEQTSLSLESSYASGRDPQPAANLTVRDWHRGGSRPGSAQPRLQSTGLHSGHPLPQQQQKQQQNQQQQQQQQKHLLQQRLFGGGAGGSSSGGGGVPRGSRIHSTGGSPAPHHRRQLQQSQQQQQQSLLAQRGSQHSHSHAQSQSHVQQPMQRTQAAVAAGGGSRGAQDATESSAAPLRGRSATPTGRFPGQQHTDKSAHSRTIPHYAQPLRSTAIRTSPGGGGFEAPGEGFTFQPRINPRSREIAERLLPVDRETRLDQLCQARNERVEQRCEQLRQEKEAEELRDCTFQPQIGRPPSVQRLRGEQPVHDRLYSTKPAWQLKREEILREREQAVLASCTFQPQCGSRQIPDDACRSSSAARRRPASAAAASGGNSGNVSGASTPHVPIHQRVADLLRSRNEKLAKAQIKMELGSGSVTFQPEINRRSAQLAAERQRQQPAEVAALPASERLYRLAQEAATRRREAGDDFGSGMRDVSASRDQRNPYQQQQQPQGVPAINPRSRALAESSDLPQDFLARQAYLAALGHEKRALYRSLLEESTCTFQPQLLSRGGSLSSSCGLGATTTPRRSVGVGGHSRWSCSLGDGDRLSKLAYEDVQRSQALRDALEQHHYGQYTFTPAINARSRRIGRRHSLTDLYRNEERQAKIERLAAAAEAERAAQCTFRPNINQRSASLGRQRRGSLVLASVEGHEQANKLRSSILTEARALREYEELKECTFTPAINRTTPKPLGPVAVPGLGRHMELRELARKKREAEEARKAEVWNLRPKSPGPRAGVTVPRPFSFEARVLPWKEQQDKEVQQRKALAALKQQRQQQRKHAEERRSAQLQRILQETQGGAYHAHQTQQHHANESAAAGGSVRALALGPGPGHMAEAQAAAAAVNGGGGGGGPGVGRRRRSVTFQSPVSGDIYAPGSARGVVEMPVVADAGNIRQADFAPPLDADEAAEYDMPYGGGGGDFDRGSYDEFNFVEGVVVEEELSVRFQ